MSASKFRVDDKERDGQRLVKWPLEYVKETQECICGWCGQPLITTEDLEAHFKTCKNSKENELESVTTTIFIKELRKVQHDFHAEIGKIKKQMDTVKAEVMEEIQADRLNTRTEFNAGIFTLKTELKKELEKKGDGAPYTFYNRVAALEETMREMSWAHETKMTDVSVRVSGMSETISTAVHAILEGMREPKEVTPSTVNHELDRLKTVTVTLSTQIRTNYVEFQVEKRKPENQFATKESTSKKTKNLPVERVPILMNCFNLVTYNYNPRPNLSWIIDGIKEKMERETFELSSDLFQWNGYPVQARANLQLKEDGFVYVSLSLEENAALKNVESEAKDIALIPQVYYLLNRRNVRVRRRKCNCIGYLTSSVFSFSLDFELCLGQKDWLLNSMYIAKDSIQLEIYVESLALAQRVHSYDGTLEWSLKNYGTRLESEQKGFVPYQESPCFYTSSRGYRVQLRLSLKGFDRGRGPVAQILFFTGEFDADLPESFPHSTTVTLVDRKEPERNMSKTIVEDIIDKKHYDLEICTMKEVKNFIEDNTLLLEVSIKSH